jgi:hypothetical protein
MQIIRFGAIFLAFCVGAGIVNQGFEQVWPSSFTEGNTGAHLIRGGLTLVAGVFAGKLVARLWKHPDAL